MLATATQADQQVMASPARETPPPGTVGASMRGLSEMKRKTFANGPKKNKRSACARALKMPSRFNDRSRFDCSLPSPKNTAVTSFDTSNGLGFTSIPRSLARFVT